MIEVIKNEDGVLLRLNVSTLDRSNAPDLREAAAVAVQADTLKVTVDCGALDFIDSSGVGALLYVSNLLPAAQRPVRLTGVTGPVLSVLELVRVHRIFEVEPK